MRDNTKLDNMASQKSSKRGRDYDSVFGDDEFAANKETARHQKKSYWDKLSTPNPRYTRKNAEEPPKKKRRVCISHKFCPPRIDQLANPTTPRMKAILTTFYNTLEPERVVRLVKLIHMNKEPKSIRHTVKKKKKSSHKKIRKHTKEKIEKAWLDQQTDVSAQLIMDHLNTRVAYTPNYKQVILSLNLMRALKAKNNNRMFKENVLKFCEQLAIIADREWEPYQKFDDVETESDEDLVPEENKKHVFYRIDSELSLSDQLDMEEGYATAGSELEEDFVLPEEVSEKHAGPSTIYEDTEEDEGGAIGASVQEDEEEDWIRAKELEYLKEELEIEKAQAEAEELNEMKQEDAEVAPEGEAETEIDEQDEDGAEIKQEAEDGADIKQEAEDGAEIKQEAEDGAEIKQEAEDGAEIKQEAEDGAEIKQEAEDGAEIKQEAEDGAEIKQEAEDGAEIKQEAEDGAEIKQEAEDGAEIKQEAEDGAEIKQEAEDETDIKEEPEDGQAELKEEGEGGEEVEASSEIKTLQEALDEKMKSEHAESVKEGGDVEEGGKGEEGEESEERVTSEEAEEEDKEAISEKVGKEDEQEKLPKKISIRSETGSIIDAALIIGKDGEEMMALIDKDGNQILVLMKDLEIKDGEVVIPEGMQVAQPLVEEPKVQILVEHPEGTASYVSYRVYSSWLEEFGQNIQTYSTCLRTFREIIAKGQQEKDTSAAQHSPAIREVLLNWSNYLAETMRFESAMKDYFKGKVVTRCKKCSDSYDMYNLPSNEEHPLPPELRKALAHTAQWKQLLANAEKHCQLFTSILESESISSSHITVDIQDISSLISSESVYVVEEVDDEY